MARVLLLEDHEIVCTVLAQFLKNGGHEVVASNTGKEVFDHIASFKPDVIVTDIIMPEMDGMELFAELARCEPPMNKRIAFVSGDVLSRDVEDFLAASGQPHVEKPLTPGDVRSLVQEMARRTLDTK